MALSRICDSVFYEIFFSNSSIDLTRAAIINHEFKVVMSVCADILFLNARGISVIVDNSLKIPSRVPSI